MISFFKNVGLYQFFFKKIRFLRAFSSLSTKNSSTFSNFSKNSKFGASSLNIFIKKLLLKNGSFKQAKTTPPIGNIKSSFLIILI